MTRVRFLIKNNNSEGNKDIISFLKENIGTLNVRNVIFEFRFIDDKEIPHLLEKGIDKLPAAFVDDILYMDSMNIKDKLSGYLSDSKGPKKGRPSKLDRLVGNPEELMDEFKRREMNKEEADKDVDDKETPNFMEDYQKELQRRSAEVEKEKAAGNGPAKKINKPEQGGIVAARPQRPSNVAALIPKAVNRDKDDDMLNRMFEETI